ncbi:hypothetical protein K469DRAFT_702655 [Zopfia rhizophila CBS 207.26]|uniref:Uncharacterized protein n=1 Tax=Zopfia rhizophila CBS 207.26 TaxID=1314779 RepID=A0A6A6EEG0_9PEZI|nr:hypothetical protein K469DRAFT_702655 [Zopfia rhizophila CBS 207.26]
MFGRKFIAFICMAILTAAAHAQLQTMDWDPPTPTFNGFVMEPFPTAVLYRDPATGYTYKLVQQFPNLPRKRVGNWSKAAGAIFGLWVYRVARRYMYFVVHRPEINEMWKERRRELAMEEALLQQPPWVDNVEIQGSTSAGHHTPPAVPNLQLAPRRRFFSSKM